MSKGTVVGSSVMRIAPAVEITVRGSRPHVGATVIAEICRDALAKHGIAVEIASGEGHPWTDHDDYEVALERAVGYVKHIGAAVKIIDNNDYIGRTSK